MSEQPKTPAPAAPAPLIVTVPMPQTSQPRQSTPRKRQPNWWTKPPVMATGALLILVVELAAYALLGLLWWAVGNLVAVLALLVALRMWRGRGQGGGLLDRLLSGGRNRAAGGAVGGRQFGLAAGRGRTATGTVAGGSSGPRGGGLRSHLPRLLGGSKGGRSAGQNSGSGGAPAGARRGLGNPLRGLGRGRAGGAGAGAAGGPNGTSGRGGGRSLRNALRGRGHTAGSSGGGSPTGGGASGGAGRRKPSRINPLNWKSWKPGDVGKAPADRKKADPETVAAARGRKPSPKPAQPVVQGDDKAPAKPEQTNQRPAAENQPQADTERQAPQRMPVPKPRHAAAPNNEGDSMSNLSHNDDMSLQRWGRNLSAAEHAAEEVQKKYAEAEAAAAQYRAVMEKINTQYQTELPPSHRLSGDLDGVVSRAKTAVTADEWRAVAADAATLPMTYKREHETDEDRLDGGRGGRAREKRADVGHAEQDN